MNPLFALGMPGAPELILLLVIVLVLFGAKRLPELARGLGQSMNEFRKAKDEFEREIQHPLAETVKDATAKPADKPADKPA